MFALLSCIVIVFACVWMSFSGLHSMFEICIWDNIRGGVIYWLFGF